MLHALREHLREPVPARPTRPSRLDLALAISAALLTLVEGALRADVPVRGALVLVGLGISATLAWRRARPFPAFVAAFALANLVTVLGIVVGQRDLGLYSSALVLLHPYALLRHGSGREVALGLALLLATYVASAVRGEMHDAGDAIGALVVLLFPAALGASLRFRDRAHRRDIEHAQLRERQMLARELHDTVAHHLTAIVIQSQAARAVLARRPESALTALGAIESEAARSLAELRALVGALRDDGPAELAPQAGAEAIEALVRDAGERARFELEGELEPLAPAVGLALHRIARESLHNVKKHARGVSRIDVRLLAERETVRLVIRDDGEPTRASSEEGFGLVGMKERAVLLGGTLDAGPLASGGWQVEAIIPRDGART